MNILKNDFFTEISGISSLSDIIGADLGKTPLLIVKADMNTSVGDKKTVAEFLTDAPFITAIASESCKEELSQLFDIVIPSDNTKGYTKKLFSDKTPKQAAEITACFTAARKYPADKVFEYESKAFYRLINARRENADG